MVRFCFLSNRKLWLSFSFQNTGFLFHHKIQLSYIWYHTLHRRIHNVAYYTYVPGLTNSVKAYLIVQMIFLTMMDRYINTWLNFNIRSGSIYNIKFTLNKLQNNIPSHNVKLHVQRMRWVIEQCSHMFVCIGHNNPNIFSTVQYINIYSYYITR